MSGGKVAEADDDAWSSDDDATPIPSKAQLFTHIEALEGVTLIEGASERGVYKYRHDPAVLAADTDTIAAIDAHLLRYFAPWEFAPAEGTLPAARPGCAARRMTLSPCRPYRGCGTR